MDIYDVLYPYTFPACQDQFPRISVYPFEPAGDSDICAAGLLFIRLSALLEENLHFCNPGGDGGGSTPVRGEVAKIVLIQVPTYFENISCDILYIFKRDLIWQIGRQINFYIAI